MNLETLEQIVRRYVRLGKPNSNGWHPCLHSCDHGRRGDRAAFIFGEDESVTFHCFNCGRGTSFVPSRDRKMPHKMVQTLQDFGIPSDVWEPVLLRALLNAPKKSSSEGGVSLYEPAELTLPTYFYRLEADDTSGTAQSALKYLSDRGIDYNDQPFYLAEDTKLSKRWANRLIIPIYKDGKVVFYQGRDLTGTATRKYLSAEVPRENILYGYDAIKESSKLPLYICEGWFDAKLLNGVAVFGRKISKGQQYWLNQTRRTKVVVPDRFGENSIELARQALDLGWAVSVPDCPNCKDISDAVAKYGLLYVLKSLRDNTKTGFEARVMIELFVEK